VTGGAGYIGSITTRVLLDAGHDCVVLDTLEKGWREAVDPRAKLVVGSVGDRPVVDAEGVRFSPPPGEREEDWFFQTWRPAAGHRASVAIRTGATKPRLRVRWLRGEEVLSGAEGTCGERAS